MPKISISRPLRPLTRNQSEFEIKAHDFARALDEIDSMYPGFKWAVCASAKKLKDHVLVFVDDRDLRDMGGFQASLDPKAEILFLQALAGG